VIIFFDENSEMENLNTITKVDGNDPLDIYDYSISTNNVPTK